MAGNVRFESTTANPEKLVFSGNYSNGPRGNYPVSTLDRSGSFIEGNVSESKLFGLGASTPRTSSSPVGDVASLTQCLLLDPITMGEKHIQSSELRRVLGISVGIATEDDSFGAAHSKPPQVVIEDLKRFKASVLDATLKARGRIRRLNESLLKLNKYCEALKLKKQQCNEIFTNERPVGSNFLKMSIQNHQNSAELGSQRLEDKTKNTGLNKRVRSSVAELRADGKSNMLLRQTFSMGKERDLLKDIGEVSNLGEEKVRRLPAGGEGWDKKMKRKRSVGTVFNRPLDNDGEVKRVMHHKFNNEIGLQSHDAQCFRSGSFSGNNGITKLDVISSSASSNGRAVLKNDPEKVSLSRDFSASVSKERMLLKANNKVNVLEDNHAVNPSLLVKGKASRGPRSSTVMTTNSSPNFPCVSGALDAWEQSPSMTKVNSSGTNNRKRAMPPGSSSSPMAQWVGQRPQKFSRTRRANLVSPVSNPDEVQMSSEGGYSYEFSSRITSVGSNGSLVDKDMAAGTQVRVKLENVSSPARLTEVEESGANENHEGGAKDKRTGSLEEKSISYNVGPPVLLSKKNKVHNKEDIGDGVRRQGRTGRGAPSPGMSISPIREKLENPPLTKPLRTVRPVSDKSGSKSGRPPLKKISDRKPFNRIGKTATGGSPDCPGDSEDDREELLAAANFACNASYLSCSGLFWKKMEPVFASIYLDDSSYLQQQLKSTEELHESLFTILERSNTNLADIAHIGNFQSLPILEGSEDTLLGLVWPNNAATNGDLIDRDQDDGIFGTDLDRRNKVTPLYQRVLSALIVEDELEEYEETNGRRHVSSQYSRDGSPGDSCLSVELDSRNGDGVEFGHDSILIFQTHEQSSIDGFPCNGNITTGSVAGLHGKFYNDALFQGDDGPRIGIFPGDVDKNSVKNTALENPSGISAMDCQYRQMCLEDRLLMELQSVGLYSETVPDLADGEDDAISQNIIKLQKELHQQICKKKEHLNKIVKAVDQGKECEIQAIEQIAMDRLVELAYKKQLATRGSTAAKLGVPKVSKQVALAFMKRTLGRYRRFEDTGKCCFSETVLRDVICATPPYGKDRHIMIGINSAAKNPHSKIPCSQQDTGASDSFSISHEQHDCHSDKIGMGTSDAFDTLPHSCDQDLSKTGRVFNKGKKKEVLLDDVGGNGSFRAASSLNNMLPGGAKGKRTERERDRDALAKNSVSKTGRASQTSIKGDRKTKPKPKQKTAQLSTPGDGNVNKFKETDSNKKQETGRTSNDGHPRNLSIENRDRTDITAFGSLELDVTEDLGDHQDLNMLLNFDVENELGGLEIPTEGLEIPMDDISDLNMFL